MSKTSGGGSGAAGGARAGRQRAAGGGESINFPEFDSGFRYVGNPDGKEFVIQFGEKKSVERKYSPDALKAIKNRASSVETIKEMKGLISDQNIKSIQSKTKNYTKQEISQELSKARGSLDKLINTTDYKVWKENPASNTTQLKYKLFTSNSDLSLDIRDSI